MLKVSWPKFQDEPHDRTGLIQKGLEIRVSCDGV